MKMALFQRRIARSLVTILGFAFIQTGISSPQTFAAGAAPIKPTISSITSDTSSITVTMVTTGIDATQWRWSVTKISGISCANSYGDGVVQSTASLSSTISITGLTSDCTYSVRVAGFNGVIGDYAEAQKVVGPYTNGLWQYTKNDNVATASMTRVPFTTGTCNIGIVSSINVDFGNSSPSGCNVDSFTVYWVGYIKAPYTGTITFKSRSDDGFYLNIQGRNIIADPTEHGPAAAGSFNGTGTVDMVSGEVYRIEAWLHENQVGAGAYLDWQYTGQTQITIPSSYFATDPSVFYGTCPLGLAPRCAADSAYQIKQATGTNMDGNYWIMVNGTPTLIYCIMNSAMSGGGWMMAMKGKTSNSTFGYASSYWTNTTQLNDSYPERWKTGDTQRDIDAKYGVFSYNKGNQIMALFPQQTTYAGGAVSSQNANYGFSWIETTTAGRQWTASDGDSYNINLSGSGGPNGSSCVTTATTLTNLFTNSNRCAFRVVSATYSASESPYSAIGDGLFYSQAYIRFFGINYGSNTSNNMALARWGFGWNENNATFEGSNDGTGGIGLAYQSYSVTTGSINGCCSTQAGISGSTNGSSTNIPFEMYVRNSVTTSVTGNNLRVVSKKTSSTTQGTGYTASGTNGSNTFRLSPMIEGFSVNSSTGAITVSENVAIGTYYETVTVVDSNGVSGFKPVTIQVVSDSTDTDTALTFDGSSQYLATSATMNLTGDMTIEAWLKPATTCSQGTNNSAVFWDSFVIFCQSAYWWTSFRDSAGAWNGVQSAQRVIPGAWTHIAVVRSGTTAYMYINNAQVKVYTNSAWVDNWTSSSIYATASTFRIGGSTGAGQYFNGAIDEVKIWDSARTLSQIWTGAHSYENLTSSNLIAYWDFNEGTGTSAISRAQRSDSTYNFSPNNSQWTTIATTATSGPYTVVTVPRTIINSIGGWRAPDSITAITALVLGGGGGGGGGYEAGGGGGGGFIETQVAITPKSTYSIKVGIGGRGAVNPLTAQPGDTSTAFGINAIGGGSGAIEFNYNSTNIQYAATSGGSGGGGSWGSYLTGGAGVSGQGNTGGSSSNLEYPTCNPSAYVGAGGGGAGGTGFAAACTKGGNGGAAKLSAVTGTYLGGGGGGSLRSATTTSHRGLGSNGAVSNGGDSGYTDGAAVGATGGATYGNPGTGTGGGAGLSTLGTTGFGADGGSGLVAFRYITALKPIFTPPTNAYLNVGMTETFTTNIAADSATVGLTRSFRWESSTAGVNGTFSVIKQGTGAANAFFSWIPTDTSTSGSNYVYRVIVTDSDTAGLFIQDTSTAVYATINKALVFTGKSTVTKSVNISKQETYTVSFGTPTYTYSLSPISNNFSLDTSTVGSPKLKISDTATVGTYYETITVTDSVSASVSIPLTIIISPPPSFGASAATVDTGTVLYLDPGNVQSYSGSGTTWTDLSGRNLSTTLAANMSGKLTGATYTSCSAPTYSSANGGVFDFTSTSTNLQCAYVANFGLQNSFTLEMWFKRRGTQNMWTSMVCNPYNASGYKLNLCLFWLNSTTLVGGIFNGSAWGTTTEVTIPDATWTHAALTYNGTTLKLVINGDTSTNYSVNPSVDFSTGSMDPGVGLVIGRKWDSDSGFNGSIGLIRIFNRVLTNAEIASDYNATKGRFLLTSNKQTQSKKYGPAYTDTYTVTAGSETITVTNSNSALTSVKYDTSTARSIVLRLTETITPGTYYDTITVTDIYGSNTRLPLTFVISKADTITVYIDTPTSVNYTGGPANAPMIVRTSGLVNSDTGTAVTSINFKPNGQSCATGGACAIGDIGPAGGIVFITPSTTGGNGKYFEVAPQMWAGSEDPLNATTYCSSTAFLGVTNSAIGWGDTNTTIAENSCMGGAVALVNNFNSRNSTGFSDWFIPSLNEALEFQKVAAKAGIRAYGNRWQNKTVYWTSSENGTSNHYGIVTNSFTSTGIFKDMTNVMVRPVRMFTPCWEVDSCTSLSTTSQPKDAGGYLIIPSGLSLSIGSLLNYQAVSYQSSQLTINKVAQIPQQIPFIGGEKSWIVDIYTGGGSGTGTQVFSLLGGGTSTGCGIDFRKFASTAYGTCELQVYKYGDRNYLEDSTTAMIYILGFISSQPSATVGGGPNIGLVGQTNVVRDSLLAPTISSLSVDSATVGSVITINGAGFYFADPTNVTIKFWRNIVALTYTLVSDNVITVTVPVGATTGRILVATPNGSAASSTFTVA